jgi:tetratricopeptide (TPR) repeat protein
MQMPDRSPTQSLEAARCYNAGVQHLRSSDVAEKQIAVGYFCRAIELDPSFDEAWFNRAIGLQSLGLHEDAISDLQALLERDSPLAGRLSQLFAMLPDVYTQLGRSIP